MENAREARDTDVAEGERERERKQNSRLLAGTKPNSIKFKVRLPECVVTGDRGMVFRMKLVIALKTKIPERHCRRRNASPLFLLFTETRGISRGIFLGQRKN